MTTTARIRSQEQTQRIWDLALQIWGTLTEATYDIGVTILTLAVAVAIYFTYWPALMSWAIFTTGSIYVVLLLRRIIQRIREADWEYHNVNEIGDTLCAMDHQITKRLAMIARNVVGPYALDDEDTEVLLKVSHDA